MFVIKINTKNQRRPAVKETLQPGLAFEFKFKVPENKTVPHLFPEAAEFQLMPKVLATGFMVGLFEWTCIQAVNPHIDWPKEQTVGVGVQLTHLAATPPGLEVTVSARLEAVSGRKLTFSITAHDGIEKISECKHERFVIDSEGFNSRLQKKIAKSGI